MYDKKTLEFNVILEDLKRFTKTSYAKEKVDEINPQTYEDSVLLINQTKEAYQAIVKYNDIPLGGLLPVKNALLRAQKGSILSEEELLNVVGLIDCGTNVLKYFHQLDNIKVSCPENKKIAEAIITPDTLKTNICLAISSDGRVLDNASRELFMVRKSLASLGNRLKSKLNEILMTKSSMLTEQLIVQRDSRSCVPVKIEFKNTFKGIVHDISSSNTTAYIEPAETLETSNQIENYKEQEKKEILTILKNLSLLVAANSEELLANLEALTELDLIYSKALMGKEYDYSDAVIVDEQRFNLKKAYHPLLNKETRVPIDIELGSTYNAIIITGPNTGGKTVALKTVGLLHLMAYYGLMIPASSESILGYYDEIRADIGDEQSIVQSLSTFSSHMTHIIEILNNVTFKSLILLDELGGGTDPKEGSSLAIAIIDYLKEAKASVILTTHYSEIKNYAYNTSGVINASVEFNSTTLKPTYRLLIGVPGKSNAVEISYRLGLNEKIIEHAKSLIKNNTSESSELIGSLEDEMTNLRNKEDALEHKINEYEIMLQKAKDERLKLIKETDKIVKEAKDNAAKILADAKEEATKLISEIKNLSDEDFKEHELADLKNKVRNLEVKDEETELFNDELKVGDYVYVKTYEKYGTISKIKSGKYLVNVGQFAIEFKRNELALANKPEVRKTKQTRLSGYNPKSHCELSLDLRGKRYEEVDYLMDKYLDQAIYANLQSVTIVHGFGTGTIRNAVQAYLKKCPYVKSYRYGKEGEGLNGVTVVYLK